MQSVDLYTAYHKGLRRKLFAFSVQLGRVDWGREFSRAQVRDDWAALRLRLQRHAAHEERYIHPLFSVQAPTLNEQIEREHHAHDAALMAMSEALSGAGSVDDESLRRACGLDIYRSYQRFLGDYLHHLDREERELMPLIERLVPGDVVAAAQLALQRSLSPEEALDSVASMLGALPDHEARQLLDKVKKLAPQIVDAVSARVEHESVLG
jgi:iron-sulfur cluster repair protein YtfE (RIC family)